MTDAFGHGTHVAGIIAGSPAPANGVAAEYAGGIAPRAKLINVKVLGADGIGFTSDVIDGIEWVVANRVRYNIRVINLSLGHPVMESCSTDPLCEAVNQAVQAGIVVVVAAGNDGKAPDGRTILGGISSPGNSPYAITVGALNTWGTVGRSDDTVAKFSSRGPTAYDLAVKPDIAAPGDEDPLARGRRCVPADDISVDSCRGQRQQWLHVSERDQHRGPDGQRRRRAAPAGIAESVSGAGEVRAAERRDGHDATQA